MGLLLLFAVLATRQAWVKSETYDEPMYMLSGYSYVVTGDLSFNREHPPLAKYLIGLPLLLLLDVQLPDDYQVSPGIEFLFYAHQPRADTHTMLFLARLPGVLLGIVLGLYVFRWARLAFGRPAALAALLLFALNPNVLATRRWRPTTSRSPSSARPRSTTSGAGWRRARAPAWRSAR
jgi:hypothetical protein